jgi:hypothetical protein
MTVGINIDLDEVEAWLEIAQQMPEIAQREAEIAMKTAVGRVEREVVPRTPVNTGALKGAWSTKVSRGSRAIKGEIVNPLVYAIVMEKGRQSKKMPPKWPIVYWLRRKFGLSLKAAIAASFPVRRAIARHGYSGKGLVKKDGAKMLEKGMEAAEPSIRRIFAKVPETVFNRLK